MNLPFSFGTKKEKLEYFLALLLRDETASVVVLGETNGKLHVVTQQTIQLHNTLEKIDFEELLDNLDKAITTVEEKLPSGASLHKTVFGVKENWVEEAHIKKDYLALLKKMSDELELKPIGFLVFSEAIAHALQQEEGAPVSAILVEIGKQATTVALIRGGKVTETHNAPNEHHITKTIETILASITSVEILPSRILLFESEESGKTAQRLLSHVWNKDLPFLHVPQVMVLSAGFDIKAVLLGTAAQLGFSADIDYKHVATPMLTGEQREREKSEEETTPSSEKLKFTDAKTIADKEDPKISTDNFTAVDFGFVTDKDIAGTIPKSSEETSVKKDENHANLKEVIEEIPEELKEKTTGAIDNKESFARDGMLMTTKLKDFFRNAFAKKKKADATPVKVDPLPVVGETVRKTKKRLNKALLILPILAILFVAGVIFYILKEKAVVTITISPKEDTKSQEVIFAADAANNFDNNQIAGTTTTLTEDGTLQAQATGTKEVGDKAKGTITIYNPNDTAKTISAGTTITSSNGLKFTLDKDVTVASAAGDIFSGTKPGTTDTSVTASDIGTDYNLPSATKFSVGGSSSIAAKNTTAFSGGTKKQVTVISKDDESKLLDALTKNLQDKAKNDMNQQASSGKVLLPVFISTKVAKKTFDKQVGDQTKSVTLTESIAFQGISYTKQDLTSYAENIVKKNLSQNIQLATNGVTADVSDAKQKSDTQISATVAVKSKVLPKLDTTKLAQAIKGESFDKAQNFLGNQSQVSHVDITLQPNIFFLPKMLPRNEKNITIVVSN